MPRDSTAIPVSQPLPGGERAGTGGPCHRGGWVVARVPPTCQAAGEPRGHSSCSVSTSGDPGRRWEFFFFFFSRGFAWNSDAHVVQNSLAPTSGAPCKSHLPAQAGRAAAGLGHVGTLPSHPFPWLPTTAAGGHESLAQGVPRTEGQARAVVHGQAGDAGPGSHKHRGFPSACRFLAQPELLLSSRL